MTDDLTRAELRRHPVFATLRDTRDRGPTDSEIERLGLPAEQARRVRQAAREVCFIRDEGSYGRARRHADEQAAAIVNSLPEQLQRPDYLDAPIEDTDDPRALAEQVARQ